mgnify:CR=1 FL=1
MTATDGEFWFCVKHHAVETRDNMCPAQDRLGPYPSAEMAARALEIVQERNDEWDNDPEWNDD